MRIQRAQELAKDYGGLVIGTGAELAYFTGSWISSHERLTCLVITKDSATMVAPATDIQELDGSLPARSYVDGEDPYAIVASLLDDGPVCLGSSLITAHVLGLQNAVAGPVQPLPAELLQVKEPGEVEQLARAAAAIDAVHAQVQDLLVAGRTEREVAAQLEELILREHVEVDFVIVGSGENGANPHHSFSDRVLEPGDPVVVDLGGRLDSGYRSDSTRTYVVPGADAPADFIQAYEVVRRAYEAGIAAAVVGTTAEQVDEAARSVVREAGLGEYFNHRLGHGIGMDTHEQPFLLSGNTTALQEGMTFSVEPGVYVPGKWGVRIEDIVTVTAEGPRRLNMRPSVLV